MTDLTVIIRAFDDASHSIRALCEAMDRAFYHVWQVVPQPLTAREARRLRPGWRKPVRPSRPTHHYPNRRR